MRQRWPRQLYRRRAQKPVRRDLAAFIEPTLSAQLASEKSRSYAPLVSFVGSVPERMSTWLRCVLHRSVDLAVAARAAARQGRRRTVSSPDRGDHVWAFRIPRPARRVLGPAAFAGDVRGLAGGRDGVPGPPRGADHAEMTAGGGARALRHLTANRDRGARTSPRRRGTGSPGDRSAAARSGSSTGPPRAWRDSSRRRATLGRAAGRRQGPRGRLRPARAIARR